MRDPISKNGEEYFNSEADRYIFILTKTDGATRCELLGITDALYDIPHLVDKWYNNILIKIFHRTDPDAYIAINILNRLYNAIVNWEGIL